MRGIAFVAALLTTSCFWGYAPGHRAAAPSALRVHRAAFVSEMVLTGQLEAARGETIAVPPLPSWQTTIKWIAPDGSEVKAGDRVAELDSGAFVSDLDTKKQAVVQAEQELAQKEAEWAADLAEKALDQDKKRVDYDKTALDVKVPEEIISARDLEDRRVKYARASVEYDKARDLLRSQRKGVEADRANLLLTLGKAKRELKEAEDAIEALTLRAPRSGVVVVHDHPWEGRKLQEGDGAWVGFPLALIPEPTSMQVTASLADVDDGKITVGMPAVVILDAYPDLSFPARVADISAVAQESAKTSLRRGFRVVVKLDRIDFDRMRSGLSARVLVRQKAIPDALVVSRAALTMRGKGATARLAGGGNADVALGPCNALDCVITGGLREGDLLQPRMAVARGADSRG